MTKYRLITQLLPNVDKLATLKDIGNLCPARQFFLT